MIGLIPESSKALVFDDHPPALLSQALVVQEFGQRVALMGGTLELHQVEALH